MRSLGVSRVEGDVGVSGCIGCQGGERPEVTSARKVTDERCFVTEIETYGMAKPCGPAAAVCGKAVLIEFETTVVAVRACRPVVVVWARAVPRRERRTVAARVILVGRVVVLGSEGVSSSLIRDGYLLSAVVEDVTQSLNEVRKVVTKRKSD